MKTRFVVQGQGHKIKKSLAHEISVAGQHTIKRIVVKATIFGFSLFARDVSKAYIQSAEELNRDIVIDWTKYVEIGPEELVLNPLYDLAEICDYWERTFRNHLEKELGMQTCMHTVALLYRNQKKH